MADGVLGKGGQVSGGKDSMTMRALAKLIASLPVRMAYGGYRAGWIEFVTVSRLLALVPGLLGVLWRRMWYERALSACGTGLYVDWMGAIRTPKTRVGRNVFIGTFCWLGWADIGDDVMLGGHVVLLSGAHHHSFGRLDIPMALQGGEAAQVSIGSDVWVGNGAIIMADVAPGSVVAAGAIVRETFEPQCILAGVPARVVRRRGVTPSVDGEVVRATAR